MCKISKTKTILLITLLMMPSAIATTYIVVGSKKIDYASEQERLQAVERNPIAANWLKRYERVGGPGDVNNDLVVDMRDWAIWSAMAKQEQVRYKQKWVQWKIKKG